MWPIATQCKVACYRARLWVMDRATATNQMINRKNVSPNSLKKPQRTSSDSMVSFRLASNLRKNSTTRAPLWHCEVASVTCQLNRPMPLVVFRSDKNFQKRGTNRSIGAWNRECDWSSDECVVFSFDSQKSSFAEYNCSFLLWSFSPEFPTFIGYCSHS